MYQICGDQYELPRSVVPGKDDDFVASIRAGFDRFELVLPDVYNYQCVFVSRTGDNVGGDFDGSFLHALQLRVMDIPPLACRFEVTSWGWLITVPGLNGFQCPPGVGIVFVPDNLIKMVGDEGAGTMRTFPVPAGETGTDYRLEISASNLRFPASDGSMKSCSHPEFTSDVTFWVDSDFGRLGGEVAGRMEGVLFGGFRVLESRFSRDRKVVLTLGCEGHRIDVFLESPETATGVYGKNDFIAWSYSGETPLDSELKRQAFAELHRFLLDLRIPVTSAA